MKNKNILLFIFLVLILLIANCLDNPIWHKRFNLLSLAVWVTILAICISTVIFIVVNHKRFQNDKKEISEPSTADKPTKKDLLGFPDHVKSLAKLIEDIPFKDTPLSIGIYGDWGSGKTSFLMMLEEELLPEIHPIWFNAWKYEKEENLWVALLQTILHEAVIQGNVFRRVWIKFKVFLTNLQLFNALFEITVKVSPIFLRLIIVLLVSGLILNWPSTEIEEFLIKISPEENIEELEILIKTALSFVAIIVAKPEEILKIFNWRLGVDFSKFTKKEHILTKLQFWIALVSAFKR